MFIRDFLGMKNFDFYIFLALFKGGWGGMQFSPMPKGEWIGFFISKAWYLVYNFALPLSVAEEAWKPLLCYTLANVWFCVKCFFTICRWWPVYGLS